MKYFQVNFDFDQDQDLMATDSRISEVLKKKKLFSIDSKGKKRERKNYLLIVFTVFRNKILLFMISFLGAGRYSLTKTGWFPITMTSSLCNNVCSIQFTCAFCVEIFFNWDVCSLSFYTYLDLTFIQVVHSK